jgi:hypothetical protein
MRAGSVSSMKRPIRVKECGGGVRVGTSGAVEAVDDGGKGRASRADEARMSRLQANRDRCLSRR